MKPEAAIGRFDPSSPPFLVGVTLGCLVGVPLTLLGIEYLAANTVTLLVVWSAVLVLAGAALCALYVYRERVLKRLFGLITAPVTRSRSIRGGRIVRGSGSS